MDNQNQNTNQVPSIQPPAQNQQVNQPSPVGFFKRYKYVIFAFSMLVILLVVFTSLIVINSKHTAKEEPAPLLSPTPVVTIQPTITSQAGFSPRSLTEQERTEIVTQTKSQLDQRIQVSYTVSKAKSYGEDWAILQVTNPGTDPANVVVKRENGVWNVMLGPGTYFTPTQLRSIGAPQSLISEANTNLQ